MKKLKYGMIGGGPGAFIGEVHRKAAALDGQIELVAGAFSSSVEKSRQMGEQLNLNPSRIYGSYGEMAEKEAKLPDDEKIDFVSVVTPNHLHYPVCKEFINAGFHIVCDKPMTRTIEEAQELVKLVKSSGVLFGLTHNYTGYPMVKEARELVSSGEMGKVRKVVAEYSQDWLSKPIEQEGQKQASWRTDPKKAGVSSAIGDIGTHAENLVSYITGLHIESIYAEITSFVEGRELEDDANILVRFNKGAKGIFIVSQISVGEENNLSIRVYGNKASLEWRQENPNYLNLKYQGGAEKILKRGNDYLKGIPAHNLRLPPGHPEGFIEAFANVYVNMAKAIRKHKTGDKVDINDFDVPTAEDGLAGVEFIHSCIKSGNNGEWIQL